MLGSTEQPRPVAAFRATAQLGEQFIEGTDTVTDESVDRVLLASDLQINIRLDTRCPQDRQDEVTESGDIRTQGASFPKLSGIAPIISRMEALGRCNPI